MGDEVHAPAPDITGDQLDIKEAASLAGVSTKTIRRYQAEGRLTAVTVKGRRGNEYRFDRAEVEAVFGGDVASRQPAKSPLEDVRSELEALRLALQDQARATAEQERLRLEQVEEQRRVIEALRAEVRDSRGQLHQLHEQLLLALPAPEPAKRKWWRFGRSDP